MTGHEGLPARPDDEVEVYERDAKGRLNPILTEGSAARGRGRMLGVSLPGAVAGAFIVTALVLGAGGFTVPGNGDGDSGPKADPAAVIKVDGDAEDGAKPTDETKPTREPAKSEPAETEKPEATPVPVEKLALEARVRDGKVLVSWTACDPDGFAWYKLVRSTDEKVTWPKGDNDTLLAAFDNAATTSGVDAKPVRGKKLWYRVFALAEVDGTLVVRCASNVVRLTVPAPDPTEKPTPKPTEKPSAMALAVTLKNGHPYADWSACGSSAFDYYKVVWSKDATVTWPLGENDHLAAAIENREQTSFKDADAPGGKTLYYRVFCVDAKESGYRVLASTGVKSIKTPSPEPAPEPVSLDFEASFENGAVQLGWQAFGGDGFVYYKVVRSQGANPSYLPWTDGTQLIGVIENQAANGFGDGDVASGQTWFYRIQAIGLWGGQKVVLGQTRVIEVAIP